MAQAKDLGSFNIKTRPLLRMPSGACMAKSLAASKSKLKSLKTCCIRRNRNLWTANKNRLGCHKTRNTKRKSKVDLTLWTFQDKSRQKPMQQLWLKFLRKTPNLKKTKVRTELHKEVSIISPQKPLSSLSPTKISSEITSGTKKSSTP